MQRITPFVDAMLRAGNLDINQAKTLVYYCIMTWSEQPRIRPLIDLHGESGTGKNSIMKQIKPWCRGVKWVNARAKTSVQIRDDLADTITAFVEEADKTKEPKPCENWYQQRYDETGMGITYRRLEVNGKGKPVPRQVICNHFGYTVLHTQNSFESIELDRRILRISLFKNSDRLYTITEGLPIMVLYQIASEIDWSLPIPQTVSNSAWDVWLPLMRVAIHLGDGEFLAYVMGQIKDKTEEDGLTKVFEPKGIVLSEITPLYLDAITLGQKQIAITTIRQKLKDRGYEQTERQIVKAARELGFKIVYPHNKAHIEVESEQRLREIGKRAGVDNLI